MLWTAFTIGLAGSLHCIGMCGPIALALPYQGRNRWAAAAKVLLYNLGRIFTYSFLGLLIGLMGKGLYLAGLQTFVSFGLGAALLLIALFSINVETRPLKIPHTQCPSALLLIGMLNGLLPCGLVYLAVAGAMATGSVAEGMTYMALFCLGTIPLILTTAMAGQFIDLRLRNRLRKLVPLFLIAFAILFIARSLHFQMPEDFRFWEEFQNIPMCH